MSNPQGELAKKEKPGRLNPPGNKTKTAMARN